MPSDSFDAPIGGAAPRKKGEAGGFDPPMAPQAPVAPTIGQGEAAGRGLLHGATLGLEGYLAAAGLGEAGGLTGEYYGTPDQILKEQRRIAAERILEARQAYPKTTGVSEFAGGMLAPIPVPYIGAARAGQAGLTAGQALLARMGVGTGVGAGIGAVSSFGGAENPTPGQFAISTGVGALTGGGVPAVAAPLGYAARAVARRLGIDRLPIFRNVEQEAAGTVTRAREEALAIEQEAQARAAAEGRPYRRQILDPAEVTPTGPAMTLDVLGAPGRAEARGAADISPRAEATLTEPLYARRETQQERAQQLLAPGLQYPRAGQAEEALARPSPQTNRAYQIAREIGDGRIELTGPLQQLAQLRPVQAAYRKSAQDVADQHSLDSFVRQQRGEAPRQAPSMNDLAVWDQVKRNMDEMYQKAADAGNRTRANLVRDSLRLMRNELDRQVPEYAEARARARAEILARDAFQEGGQFLTKGDTYETEQALARLATEAPQAVEQFRQGFTHAMLTRAGKKPTEGNLYAQIKASPDATERMRIALGGAMVQRLEQQRATEDIMQRGLQAVTGQSQTARFFARQRQNYGIGAGAIGLGGAAITADDLLDIGQRLHSGSTGAGVVLLTAAMSRHIDARVAERIAQMLISRDTNQLAVLAQRAQQSTPLQSALQSARDALQPALVRGAAGTAAGAVAP